MGASERRGEADLSESLAGRERGWPNSTHNHVKVNFAGKSARVQNKKVELIRPDISFG
jgi:hypothetical protein